MKLKFGRGPVKRLYRQIGDSLILGTTSISAFIMTAPFSPKTIQITVFVLNIIGVAGKLISNLFKEENNPPS